MVDSIKITALQDIGANIAYTTLVPVVDMSSTPTTKKSTLQNVGNLILGGAGGSYFPRAAQANLALSVANAAQPNITSVGTLNSLTLSGALTWTSTQPSDWAIKPNQNNELEIHSHTSVVISTDTANSNSHFTFDSDGIFTAPSNVNLLGTRLNIGHEAPNISLQTPTIVIADSSNTFVQSALFNNDANGSADWVAYGTGGNDSEGWADIGFAGPTFSDENYTITEPGDGYVFVQGYANVGAGSLVLATGNNGTTKDIVFSTGGFTQADAFARMEHNTNMFHLVRPGGGIQFEDGTIQSSAGIVWTTAPVSNTSPGTPGQAAYDAGGNLFICVAANTWSKFSGTTSW